MGYSPWGDKESDMTEGLTLSTEKVVLLVVIFKVICN